MRSDFEPTAHFLSKDEITEPEHEFDDIVRMAADLCRAPLAVVNLATGGDYWFSSREEIPNFRLSYELLRRELQAVGEGDVLAVEDTHRDKRFCDDPLFAGPPPLHSFAGIILKTSSEHILGTLSVFDLQLRSFSKREIFALRALARQIVTYLELRRSLRETAKSEERFRSTVEGALDCIISMDASGRICDFNPAAEKTFGFEREEIIGRTLADTIIPPEFREAHTRGLARYLATKTGPVIGRRLELPAMRSDGTRIFVELAITALKQDPPMFTGFLRDITRRKQREEELSHTHRALEMLTHCDEAVMRADDENDLLRQICEVAVVTGGYRMAWVGYAETDAHRTITPMAWFGEGGEYLTEAAFSYEAYRETGEGPAGRAMQSGELVVCSDISTDPSMFPWRELAQRHGFGSLVCLPLKNSLEPFAIFCLYSVGNIEPTDSEISLLAKLAEDLAFGISHLRSRETQKRLEGAVRSLAASSSFSGGSKFFEQLTTNMVAAVGATVGFISQKLAQTPSFARTLSLRVKGREVESVVHLVPESNWGKEMEQCPIPNLGGHDPLLGEALKRVRESIGCRLETSSGDMLGILWTGFEFPPSDLEFAKSTLQVFASRAASEMYRQQLDNQVQAQASLLDKAQDAIMVRDLAHRITYWNKSAERLYGWTSKEVLGRPVQELLYRNLEAFQQRSHVLMESGEWSGEIEQLTKEGRTMVVEARINLVRDEEGTPVSILSIITDVTERKILEAKFLRVQRMESIGNLASGIAHDLNNVFAPILLAVDLLAEKVNDKEGRALVSTLRHSSQHGADLVRQVLSFARGVEGQRLPVNLVLLVRDLEEIICDTFPKSIRFSVSLAPDLWITIGDVTQLHQVLVNFCVNARAAMPNGGDLKIIIENVVLNELSHEEGESGHQGNFVRIKILDTGVGIDVSIRDKIFEPFFTTKPKGEGTGLGLSTSHAIIKSHGGFMVLASKPTVGTDFRIYLPADPSLREEAPNIVDLPGPSRGHGETILVVDDEESIRGVCREILEHAGYHVLTASEGNEAVSIFEEHREKVALVLTDMAMPGLDGPQTIALLRARKPSLPIVGSSGLTSKGEASAEAGRQLEYFISKPYSSEALLRLIAQALEKSYEDLQLNESKV